MLHVWYPDLLGCLNVKQTLARIDSRGCYPLRPPNLPATAEQLAAAENTLGGPLDAGYRAFLEIADGWPHLYGQVHLFGTADLCGSEDMALALHTMTVLEEAGALAIAGVRRADLLPIAAAPHDLDLFVLLGPKSATPGAIIWFAEEEIERYPDFSAFFNAMIDANRDIITMLSFATNDGACTTRGSSTPLTL